MKKLQRLRTHQSLSLPNIKFKVIIRKNCNEEKLSWSDYVKMFRSMNPEIPDDFYGKWFEIFKTAKMPDKSDFNLPTTKEL